MAEAVKKQELNVRGRLTENAPLGAVGWFRCGGTADLMFKPEDIQDLRDFLAQYPSPSHAGGMDPSLSLKGEGNGASPRRSEAKAGVSEVGEGNVSVFGVLSNTIVRDGGVRGAVIRLGKEFAAIETDGDRVRAGALALDANVALAAANAGIAGLEFFSGIPGTVGGALRMNAGCYGTETKDVLVEVTAIDRQGNLHIFKPCHPEGASPKDLIPGVRSFADAQDDNIRMDLSYRHNNLSADYIFLSAVFRGRKDDPDAIRARMAEIKAKREASQPIREKTGGSTFANPSAAEIAGAGLPEGTKVWQLIDRAGCRGLTVGGAQMSEMHCNFMINTGTASAADLENLGEEVRRRVYENCGIALRWEIKRVGEH